MNTSISIIYDRVSWEEKEIFKALEHKNIQFWTCPKIDKYECPEIAFASVAI